MSKNEAESQVYYSPDDLEEREWLNPDDFVAVGGPFDGWKFRMLIDGSIILISKNGDKDAKAHRPGESPDA